MKAHRERWSERASKRSPGKNTPCKEPSCNQLFQRFRYDQEFCCKACRTKYNARALSRARGLYEPLQAWHKGKSRRAIKGDILKDASTEALRFIGRTVADWRDEDAAMRAAADETRNPKARA